MSRKIMLICLSLLLTLPAHAIPIHIDAGRFAVSATDLSDGGDTTLDAADFHILAADGADYVLFADGRFIRVAGEALQGVLSGIGSAAKDLPDIGDAPDDAARLQQALIDLGYLDGTADGRFGKKSRQALMAFQTDMGLEPTGASDVLTGLLAESCSQDIFYVIPEVDPDRMYAEIAGRTDFDLSRAAALGLALEFDDMAGVGTLSNGNRLEYAPEADADMDRCAFTLRAVLSVTPDGDRYDIEPAMRVECLCVRRPVMQRLILKAGDARVALDAAALDSGLRGVQSVETAVFTLDDEAVALLAKKPRDLKIRIDCKYGRYDLDVPEDVAARMGEVAGAA